MHIDAFIESSHSGDCQLLKRLYDFERAAKTHKWGYIEGLILLDIGPYDGTVLYRPGTTPQNSLTFACTGGDDVHFGLVGVNGQYGDSSPVVMTVPMAGDSIDDTNFIVGETLHEFLCLGCVHGFFYAEELAYSWRNEFFDRYANAPSTDENRKIYEKFQSELSLTPWISIESRLHELDSKIKPLLRFKHPSSTESECAD